ncbi:MAG: hypothetical protein HAW59_05270, partial [Betaproteobacteria bacterium]|nr:hypothetical protein [Betaproteobacteria bacterium]
IPAKAGIQTSGVSRFFTAAVYGFAHAKGLDSCLRRNDMAGLISATRRRQFAAVRHQISPLPPPSFP